MRQVAQNYKTGELILTDVPVPACAEGGVVVRTAHSLVSAGTELMKVAESKMSYLGKARARPDQVKKVIDSVVQQGPAATYRKVMNRLDSFTPLGYSLAGTVVESAVADLPVGTRVACAGNEYALHADYNWVPANMCVRLPDGVDTVAGSFATVGAIALHGFRRSEVTLGETAVVFGLGLIGQILVRLLTAGGAHVVGIDLDPDRCRIALAGGAAAAGTPGDARRGPVRETIDGLTDGYGVDHVFLCAATDSNEPTELSAELVRERGRITDIGKVRLDLPWKEYYGKELDVVFSRSYGPGRYDPSFEIDGIDYPYPFVRWTMQRNMRAFLELLAGGRIRLDDVVSAVVPFTDAVATYEQLDAGSLRALGVVFEYESEAAVERVVPVRERRSPTARMHPRFGVIGAGNYATTMLLPHLAGREDVELATVATSTALSARTAVERFGFQAMTTDYREILDDETVDGVVVATRHDSHARIAAEALERGKTVFVEKPLALDEAELEQVAAVIDRTGNDRLMVGFNRRFAPLFGWLRDRWSVGEPQMVSYTVNAGPLPGDSWYRQAERHGSRFVGEGGHFIDTVSWWLGSDPVLVSAVALGGHADDLEVLLRYPDGSVARISYVTVGSTRYPKETFLVSTAGRTARLDNFRVASLWGSSLRPERRRARAVDKGQAAEMDAFVHAVRTGGPMPIPAPTLMRTTEATLAAARAAVGGSPVRLGDPG